VPGRPAGPDEVEAWISDLESVVEATRLLGDAEFSLAEWLRAHLPVSPTDVAVAELAIWLAGVALHPVEGARDALEWAHRRGLTLGVVSNLVFSGRTLEFELRRHGFGMPLQTVLSSADCGRRKPSEAPFCTALARLGVSPEEAWFVGDSWECDVVGASGVGMTALWLSCEEAPGPDTPHHRVGSWKDVVALLEAAVGP
jgi:putative hydrolase of the HAD superfamily